MQNDRTSARVAVIGLGPRGLGALESLASQAQKNALRLSVDIIDPFPSKGAGPNFDPQDSPTCLLNIPVRDIALDTPPFGTCGSFDSWSKRSTDPDSFPPRAELGRYLETRLADLRTAGPLDITMRSGMIDAITRSRRGWTLHANGAQLGPYAEVLLTIGQPRMTPDPQLAQWQDHAKKTAATLVTAYPARHLAQAAAEWTGRTVGIRGMALSTFDILRLLTIEQGGHFGQGRYHPSGREPARILPFSLDGKPPFPKPATTGLDARYSPLPDETEAFSAAIAKAVRSAAHDAPLAINAALLPPVSRIMRACNAFVQPTAITDWLAVEWSSPGAQEKGCARSALEQGIAMAQGIQPPTIGYAIGQLWRKWQNTLRRGFNNALAEPDTAKTLLGFDEGLKRYSYGPPVSSSKELLALIDCGIVDLTCCTDPDINLTPSGWILASDGQSAEVEVMIDGVMPPPDLSRLPAGPVAGLLKAGWLAPHGDGLSARIAADGSVMDHEGQKAQGLCLLGRLASGSVIAADSLHDCFGQSGQRWAEGVIRRRTGG